MTEEQSLLDYLAQITPTDEYIIIPSIIGALMLCGWWMYKQYDRQFHFQLDETKKQFRLGYFYTVLTGFVGGSLLGVLSRTRAGLDLESASLIAFVGGILTPWIIIKGGHTQWHLVVRAAKHPILSQVQYAPQKALPHLGGKQLSAVDRRIMEATGSTTTPIDEAGLKDWEHRRELIMSRLLSWWKKEKITKQELEEIHAVFPAVGDVRKLLLQVRELEGQQTNLSLSQKLGYEKMIFSQKQLITEYNETVQEYKGQLERGQRAQDPQYQLTKQVIYGFFGFIFRQVLIWVGV